MSLRVNVTILQKVSFDMDLRDTIGKLRRLVVKNIIDTYDLDDPGVYLHFNGHSLDDDSATLQEAGISNGAAVTAVSEELAVLCGSRANVTSVKAAFKHLATSGDSGAEAESMALEKHCKPFGMSCDTMDLGELAAGWPLFFDFIKFVFALCIVLLLCQVPAVITFMSGDPDGLTKWPAAQPAPVGTSAKMVSRGFMSAGNLGPGGSSSIAPGWSALASVVALLALATHYSRRQRRLKHEIDAVEVDPNDFALFIEGLPLDATDEKELAKFIESHAREKDCTEVVKVVLGFDIDQFKQLTKDFVDARSDFAEASTEEEKQELQQKLKLLQGKLSSPVALQAHLNGTGFAVVLLRHQSHHRECLEEWDTCWEEACWNLSVQHRWSDRPRFREEHVLRIQRAPNPSDIIWENMNATFKEKLRARLKTYLVLLCIVTLSFVVVWFCKLVSGWLKQPWWMSIITSLALVCANLSVAFGTRYFANQQRHATRTGKDVSIMVLLTVGMVLNYSGVSFAINYDADQNWYRRGGLLNAIFTLTVVNALVMPILTVSGFKWCCKRAILKSVDPKKPGMTQATLNKLHEPPEMDAAKSYAYILKLFFLSLLFAPLIPLVLIVGLLGVLFQYWAFKRQLLQLSKRPYSQSDDLARAALCFIYWGALIFSFSQVLFLSPSLTGAGKSWVAMITAPLAIASVVFLFLPRRLSHLLCGTCLLRKVRKGETETDIDYYDAQRAWPKHRKYHTSHLVYLQLERLYMLANEKRAGKVTMPWDPKTGDLRGPAQAPDEVSRHASIAAAAGLSEPDIESTLEYWRDAVAGLTSTREADLAALALEDLKFKVPVATLRAEGPEGSVADVGGDEDLEVAGGILPGMLARVNGLEAAAAKKFNGEVCTVKSRDAIPGKWLVEFASGTVARIPEHNLEPLAGTDQQLLQPGMKVRVFDLTSASGAQYNDTLATLVEWNGTAGKWTVVLFTGVKASIACANLKAA
jgi:hypothetical protein